jgi:hypothetical protein
MTGANSDYTSETGNDEQVRLANEVGEGFYLKAPHGHRGYTRDYSNWEKTESRVTLEEKALKVATATIGGHNSPPITLTREERPGWGKVRVIRIDGEVRGFWVQSGSRWEMYDDTAERVVSNISYILFNEDGTYERKNSDTKHRISLYKWSEREALVYTYEAWCDDLLPSTAEQKVRTERKEAKRRADHAKEEVLKKLGGNYEVLLKVIEQASQQGIEGADALIRDIAAGNEQSAKWFEAKNEGY